MFCGGAILELLYYWVDKYRKIKEQGFNFGGEYIFEYKKENKELIINENSNYFKDFYNSSNEQSRIVNISAIVGKNGSGKTTVLDALSGMLHDGGILRQITENDSWVFKRILAANLNNKIRVIFYKSLIDKIVLKKLTGEIEILYENDKIKNEEQYKFEIIVYDENNKESMKQKDNTKRTDLQRVIGSEFIEKVTSIIFSNVFYDNYNTIVSSRKEKSYYDISLMGLLKGYEENISFNKSNMLGGNVKPFRKRNIESKFNQGIIKNFYLNEFIKQLEFVGDKDKYDIIPFILPEELSVSTDIFHERKETAMIYENGKFMRCEDETINKYKSEEKIYNMLNMCINDDLGYVDFEKYIKTMNDKKKREVIERHFLQRILDAFFEDLNQLLFFEENIQNVQKKEADIDYSSFNDIIRILTEFSNIAIKSIEELNKTNEDYIIEIDDVKNVIISYKKLISEFLNFTNLDTTEFKVYGFYSKVKVKGTEIFNSKTYKYEYNDNAVEIITKKDLYGRIIMKTNKEDLELIKGLLNSYKELYSEAKFLFFEWSGISSGEHAFLNFYSRFNHLLSNERINDNVFIILDEPATYFHPEWERRFLEVMIKFIPMIIKCKTIQVVFTANNPIALTDITKTNVIHLRKTDKKENDNIEVVDNITKKQTFGANIHTLFTDNFFLDTTIGEFALKKIKAVIKDLTSDGEVDEIRKKEIKHIINNIGEYIIKSKLEKLYDKKFSEATENYSLKIRELEEEKDRLQKMIELKGINNIDNVMKVLSQQIKELKKKAGTCDDID
ncbi:UNVERIFIED_CONTAM: putative AbiEii toxin of type IV toxin-antitoxin system [Acetivibrio alkalicellulosi]